MPNSPPSIWSLVVGFFRGKPRISSSSPAPEVQMAQAIRRNDTEALHRLLDQGMDVNATDSIGFTALHWACFHGHLEVAQVLLERGACVDARDRTDRTPLHMAAQSNAPLLATLLLNAGAVVLAKDYFGQSALGLASEKGCHEVIPVLESFEAAQT